MRQLVFIALLLSGSCWATLPVDKLPDGSRTAFVSGDLSHTTSQQSQDQLFPPASTLKVITALAAKLELGDEFRFSTRLERVGAEYVLRFSGDPTLTSKDLASLLKQAKVNGLKEITNLYLDGSVFTGYERGVGWPWDILGVCYSAPASAITLDKNCVQASIKSLPNGRTEVFVPSHQPITVSTVAIALNKVSKKSNQCDLELTTTKGNSYHLSGCMLKRDKPLPLKFALQDTVDYTEHVLKRLLNEQGIKLKGQIRHKSVERQGKLIAVHQSQSLVPLLDVMLKQSNNLIADNLTKALGNAFFHQPGSFANGAEAIKQVLFTHTGIDLTQAVFTDGSGLSRNNRITAQDMAKVLQYIWQNDSTLNLIALLPVAGESGTLLYRKSIRKAPYKGAIQAKSGSLFGTYNLAGYILDESGAPKSYFVQFVTDYHPIKRDDAPKVLAPIYQFEQALYKDLLAKP
ncbi:serine-type D-Ala-D-Ala carboxypeptidase [Vibrio sp. SCSIO 43136]|uniref:serine-type D-Ala-D-Ala carboxypeptidase n=1 Tax=Vibrio sp. SCSIO 43136 TaxID=2819101 RepID=UPI00207560DA|nr:serine-type D-Ala-D-Ala carboxypeptidase [Vibrio sp. SCSIO 43136]USD64784.1 serine-type D-Ala-D-Ala carboxypeptidase [Vibrio sp. SCSIO 43136]